MRNTGIWAGMGIGVMVGAAAGIMAGAACGKRNRAGNVLRTVTDALENALEAIGL